MEHTKLEKTKPFCLEQALAGAPVCGENRQRIKILTWDRKHPTHPIVGMELEGDQEIIAFRTDGETDHGIDFLTKRLVMERVAQIDSKPVFFGDELVTVTGERIIVGMEHLGAKEGERPLLVDCRWPAPAKVYPETRMTFEDVIDAVETVVPRRGVTLSLDQACAIANAALRHAIDAGQVMLPGAAMRDDDIMDAFSKVCAEEGYSPSLLVQQSVVKAVQSLLVTEPEVEQLKADAKRASMELGKAERLLESHGYRSVGNGDWRRGPSPVKCFYGHPKKGLYVEGDKASIDKVTAIIAGGKARDIAVAEAVRDACQVEVDRAPVGFRTIAPGKVDLAAVIDGVKP